jgi:predicted transposase/invertase (TIGR01784 family)
MPEDFMKDFIDICQDAVFKAVFTKPSPQSETALSSLLSAFVEQKVSVLNIQANEIPLDNIRQRQIRFDISVKFNSGELADVEITLNPKPGENLRMEYYSARLFGGQDIKGAGRSFKDLKATWQISFLAGRTVFKDRAWFHRFKYYDQERGISLDGRTAIIGVELSKLGEVVKKPVGEMSLKERWAVYLGYYRDEGKRKVLKEIEEYEEGIGMAEAVVNGFTQHELEMLREISLHRRQMDYQEDMIEMQEEARVQGQKQLIDLLESGKSLEEAKHILGFK